jgi:large subunit ribosomal protein LP1
MSNTELACSYAALILADETLEITPDKILILLKAAGIEDIEPIWTTLFAKALKDKDVNEILTSAPVPGQAAAGGAPLPNSNDAKTDENSVKDEIKDGDPGDDIDDSDEEFCGLFGTD